MALTEKEELELLELEEAEAGSNPPTNPEPTKSVAPSVGESMARGATQGATMGFADELAGVQGALSGQSGSSPASSVSGLMAVAQPGVAMHTFLHRGSVPFNQMLRDYFVNRDAARNKDAAAQQANPWSYGGANVVGGIASGAGMAAPASLVGRVKQGMGLGAAAGFGFSNSDLAKGELGKAATDTATGLGLGGAAPLVTHAAVKLGPKALRAFLGTPEDITEGYLKNPKGYNEAPTIRQTGQKIADTLGEMREDAGPLHDATMATLSTERNPIPGFEARPVIERLRAVGDKKASEMADQLEQQLRDRSPMAAELPRNAPVEPNHEFLNDIEMHNAKKLFQDLGDYRSPLPTSEAAAAHEVSGGLNRTIKQNNPAYDTAIGKEAQTISTRNDLASKFGLERNRTATGYQATDRTTRSMKDLINANKIDRGRVMDSVKELGYGDLADEVKKSLGNAYFKGESAPNGSRRALLFNTIGRMIGAVGGHGNPLATETAGAIGAAAGAAGDIYAPRIAKKVLDTTIWARPATQSTTAAAIPGAIAREQRSNPVAAFNKEDVINRVKGTPWEQTLGNAKTDDDFALRYYALQKGPEGAAFRGATAGTDTGGKQ